MRLMRARVGVIAVVSAMACSARQTAIVLEVNKGVAPETLEEVVFRVRRVDIADAGREAVAPVKGPGAKPFPLEVVLVSQPGSTARFDVSIEGRDGGRVMAVAVPAEGEGPGPVTFVANQVIRRRYVLQPLGASHPDGGQTDVADAARGTSPMDGAAVPASRDAAMSPGAHDAAVDQRPPSPPEPGPGEACGGSFGVCRGGLMCVAGRCCVSECKDDCLAGTCSTAGVCEALPNGTPCHGNSGMMCESGRCVKPAS
jgi:hypothetical protein